jgi:hypothetical protein
MGYRVGGADRLDLDVVDERPAVLGFETGLEGPSVEEGVGDEDVGLDGVRGTPMARSPTGHSASTSWLVPVGVTFSLMTWMASL